jgi:signal transduction histidine kinase
MMIFMTFFTIVMCFFFAGIIYARKPHHPGYVSMSLLSICLALWTISNWLSLQPLAVEVRFFWVKVVMMITILIPWLFLRFALYFPEHEGKWRRYLRWMLPGLLLWTVGLMMLSLTPYMFSQYQVIQGAPSLKAEFGVALYGLTFLSFCSVGAWMLYQTLQNTRGLAKVQAAYVLLGLLGTVIVGFTTNFLFVTFFQNFQFIDLGPVSSLFFLVTVSYAMLRYRFMDVRWTVVRGVAYFLTLCGVIIGYSSLLTLLTEEFGQNLTRSQQVIASVMSTTITCISFPLLLKVSQKVGQQFFHQSVFIPEKAHQSLAQITAVALSVDRLMEDIGRFFCVEFGVNWCGVTLVKHSTSRAKLLKKIENYWKTLGTPSLIVCDELQESRCKDELRRQDIMVLVPLLLNEQLIGWVGLGHKHSGNAYSVAELQFCQVVAAQIALAFHHAKSYGRAKEFSLSLRKEVSLATKELRVANTRLSELDQLKDEFVSIASHELRTPMTAIKSYLWLCLFRTKGVLPDTARQHLQVAYAATERLLLLVKDLLTVSQLEAGRLRLQLEKTNVLEMLRSITQEATLQAQEKDVKIITTTEVEELHAELDQVKVVEVIQNILGNAIKFSPAHTTVHISLQDTANQISFSIQDQGRGISDADQKLLFQKFGVLQHHYRTSTQQGTGLGLYIAQQFTQLHGGEITVSSSIGQGTTFVITLPKYQHQKQLVGAAHAQQIVFSPSH